MIVRMQQPVLAVTLTAAVLAMGAAVMVSELTDDHDGTVASGDPATLVTEVPSWEIELLQARRSGG